MRSAQTTTQVIGLGNALRGDDGIGLEVARAIARRSRATHVVAGVPDGFALLELWDGVPLCFVVDCAVSGRRPGTLHVFDGLKDHIPDRFFSSYSTHAIPMQRAIELGWILGRLPRELHIYGIEGGNFEAGSEIAEPVRGAGRLIVQRILVEIQNRRLNRSWPRTQRNNFENRP